MKPTSSVPRRTFLRGTGALLALPLLEAMLDPKLVHGAAPVRFIGWFHPNGFNKDLWTPTAEGAGYTLPPSLASLAPVKDDLLVLTGLQHGNGTIGSHDAGLAALFTASTSAATTSIDQVIAEKTKAMTALPSLQLSLEINGQYDPVSDNNNDGLIDSPTDEFDDTRDYCSEDDCRASVLRGTRLPNMTNPRLVFERLFAGGQASGAMPLAGGDSAALQRRKAMRKGLLDVVLDDSRRLQNRLGAADKARLEEYMSGLREIERTLERSDTPMTAGCTAGTKPKGMPLDLEARSKLLIDMVVKAFQCDLTRSVTLMYGRHTTNMRFAIEGQSVAHHDASHWAGDPAKKKAKDYIDAWLVKQFSYLLQELKKSSEAGQSLLENTIAFCSSDISDPNLHDQASMPVLLGGHGGGAFKPGRHIRSETQGKQIGDLFLNILEAFGIQQSKFGEFGTQKLAGLK